MRDRLPYRTGWTLTSLKLDVQLELMAVRKSEMRHLIIDLFF
jgi:hypothetical protein